MNAEALKSLEERYKDATEQHQGGNLDVAAQLYAQILSNNPRYAPALHMSATLAFQKGDNAKALKGLTEAIDLGYRTTMLWWHYGCVLLALSRFKEAVTAFQTALLDRPGDADLLFNLGTAAQGAGFADVALPALKEAASKLDTASAYYQLGLASQNFGQRGSALKAYLMALERNRDFAEAALNAGVLAHEAGDLPYAISLYRQALKTKPDLTEADLNLGVALSDQGDPQKAAEHFLTILAKMPQSIDAWNNLGVALERLGNPNEAIKAYLEVLSREPLHIKAIENLATSLRRSGQEKSILDYPYALSKEMPEKPEAWIILGRALEREGKYDEALAALNEALKRDPTSPQIHDLIGTIQQLRQDLKTAFTHYSQAVALAPYNIEYLINLGLAALRIEDTHVALTAFDTVLSANRYDQRAIAYRALALRQAGEIAKADDFTDPSVVATTLPFPHPPLYKDQSDFLAQLSHDLRHISGRSYAPYGQSVRGGTQTENMLFGEKAKSIEAFRQTLDLVIKNYLENRREDEKHPFFSARPDRLQYRSWSVILKKGGHHIPHIHPGGCISGVFYVEVPKLEGHEGYLELGRPGIQMPLKETPPLRLIKPEPGLLILFPSYLWHGTLPFSGDGERITIAFDVIQT